jgi:hypothetical protein
VVCCVSAYVRDREKQRERLRDRERERERRANDRERVFINFAHRRFAGHLAADGWRRRVNGGGCDWRGEGVINRRLALCGGPAPVR